MKTDRDVYLVQGSCWDIENDSIWVVAAYLSKSSAEAEAKRLTDTMKSADWDGELQWRRKELLRILMANAGDPTFAEVYADGTTTYSVVRVRLYGEKGDDE